MNDDMMIDYLLQMGAMRPEEQELKRRQAMVEALRGNALDPMQGQMIGKHYVGPGVAGALAKVAQGYMAGQAQRGLDTDTRSFNDRQRQMLEDMRKRRRLGQPGMGTPVGADPYGSLPTYGSEA